MAGDWIKWTKGLAKKPEVLHMAALLGRTRHEVAGLLMEFWEWCDDNVTPESASASCPGFVRIVSASTTLVDTLTGAGGFAESMSAVGWLVIRDGALELPKFGRHNGKPAKSRALDAERKRTNRESTLHAVRKVSGCEPDKKRTREEKSREEDPPTPLEGGGNEVLPCPRPARSPPPGLSPGELAATWTWYLRRLKHRNPADAAEDVLGVFEEMIRLGVSPAAIDAEIRREDRDRSEYVWEMKKRLTASREVKAKGSDDTIRGAAERRQQRLERESRDAPQRSLTERSRDERDTPPPGGPDA